MCAHLDPREKLLLLQFIALSCTKSHIPSLLENSAKKSVTPHCVRRTMALLSLRIPVPIRGLPQRPCKSIVTHLAHSGQC